MQFEWNSKDSISFGLYKEVIESKSAQFLIWLESDNREVNLIDIRTGGVEYRFNNFVIRESSESNTITFCPNIAGCPAYFRINTDTPVIMSIIRKDGTPGEESTFMPGEIKLELNPAGMRKYKVNVDGNVSSGQENVIVAENSDNAAQEEIVPEFFGGSFSSASEQEAGSSTSDALDSVDDTSIFSGEFNSEDDSGSSHDAFGEQHTTTQQPEVGASNSAAPLFADMFPATGGGQKQESSSTNNTENQGHTGETRVHPIDQNTGAGPSNKENQQGVFAGSEVPSSSGGSGFSVQYVETEGIKERKVKVQDLQHDNDRAAKEVEKLEKQISELENQARQLSDSKSALISHLETLQREYDKDYSKFQADIDEIKGRYTVDKSILEFYKDRDLVSIEDILKQTEDLVHRVEEQIRLFVAAQQSKSDEIEKALKVGKKE